MINVADSSSLCLSLPSRRTRDERFASATRHSSVSIVIIIDRCKPRYRPSPTFIYFLPLPLSLVGWQMTCHQFPSCPSDHISNVAAKAYRTLSLYEPGEYTATLSYYNGQQTVRIAGFAFPRASFCDPFWSLRANRPSC